MHVDAGLRANFRGELIEPGDPRYDAARRVWNADVERRPGLIARCRGTSDVRAALRFARDRDQIVSIRGGGHSVAGYAVCDRGVVVDLSLMNGIRVDPVKRTVWVEGGCLNQHLDRESELFGFATTGGMVSHTGIAGLTLGGGLGHLMRKFGLAIDNLLSCDVVGADGELLTAAEDRNEDLFWGLRGGGGNFGVVTSFEFRLHPLPSRIVAGMLAWPISAATEVLRFMREFAACASDEVGMTANLRLAPAVGQVPAELQGQPVVALVITYAGPAEASTKALAPLRDLPMPAMNSISAKSYVEHQKSLDAAFPHGRHYYWKGQTLGPLSDDIIDVLIRHAGTITSPFSTVPIMTLGGAVARVQESATAYPHRLAAHDINISAAWLAGDPRRDEHIAWVRDFHAALERFSRGVYVNFTSDDPAHKLRAYSAPQWQRLVALKTRYDPDNVFRLNVNIPPKRSGGDTPWREYLGV